MTEEELLKYIIENGIFNLQEISDKANIELMKKVDEVHKYKLTKLNGENDKRWQTHVADKNRKHGRRMVKAPTKEKLYLKLAEIYGIIEKIRQ